MTYQLVYKCALCGARVVIGEPTERPDLIGREGALANSFRLSHNCPDGSIGGLSPAGFVPYTEAPKSTGAKKSPRRPRKVADK